jgi:arginine deiminase
MRDDQSRAAAFGGAGWRPRKTSLEEEMGSHWGPWGVRSEWERLQAVLLHAPGPELEAVTNPDAALMKERPDADRAAREHGALAELYRAAGVDVHFVDPPGRSAATPNLMYVADLFFMTPEGAILARPAGEARSGEERWVQRRLADLGVPILRAVGGRGSFEGADAMWLDRETVLLGRGLRTNEEGLRQVAGVLEALGVEVLVEDLPPGTMHLMGQLRILDRDLAFVRRGRFSEAGIGALRERGYEVLFFPDEDEMERGFAENVVTLGPRRVVMPEGCPRTRRAYEAEGVRCRTVRLVEIPKAAGGIGCLSGILRRG